jgi:hypothetical protein
MIALLLFLSVACGKGHDASQRETSTGSLLPESKLTIDDPVPLEAETFQVNITYINFSADQREKYEKAAEIVRRVVANPEFKARVIGHTYNGVATYVDNEGQSNATIYQKILNGDETLKPERNNQLDVEVELYYADTNTIGYTYPNGHRIWVNTKYFDTYTPASVAANLFHEWLHKLGYQHAVEYAPSREYSVPYAIGKMMNILGKKIESEL